jgi:hypothetical protein
VTRPPWRRAQRHGPLAAPHAGGEIIAWSHPIEGEIRDDQGISMLNPDTGLFMRYKLAGAYDSNIALLLTTGSSRGESYARLAEVLRRTSMRGPDLATNLEFHYGLVHWFLSNGVDAKPTTRFVVPYLTLVGLLKEAGAPYGLLRHRRQRRPHHRDRAAPARPGAAGPHGAGARAAAHHEGRRGGGRGGRDVLHAGGARPAALRQGG